jgi:hypothetical protein
MLALLHFEAPFLAGASQLWLEEIVEGRSTPRSPWGSGLAHKLQGFQIQNDFSCGSLHLNHDGRSGRAVQLVHKCLQVQISRAVPVDRNDPVSNDDTRLFGRRMFPHGLYGKASALDLKN